MSDTTTDLWGLTNPCPAGPSEDYTVPPVDHDTVAPGLKCPGCGNVVTPTLRTGAEALADDLRDIRENLPSGDPSRAALDLAETRLRNLLAATADVGQD